MTNQILLIRKEKAKMDKKAAKEQKKADAKAAKEAKKVAKAEKAAAKKEAKAAKKHEKEVKKMGHSGVRERKATVVPVYSIEHTGGAFEDRKNHEAEAARPGTAEEPADLTAPGGSSAPGTPATPGVEAKRRTPKGRSWEEGGHLAAAAANRGGTPEEQRATSAEAPVKRSFFFGRRAKTPKAPPGVTVEEASQKIMGHKPGQDIRADWKAEDKDKKPGILRRLWLWVYDYAKRTYQKRVVGIDVYEGIDYSMYEPHMKDFFYLGLKKRDVVRLLNVFLEVDMDRSGLVDDLEFLTFIDAERTPFARKVFDIFDNDASNEIDFVEFVSAIWNFCSQDQNDVMAFAFECFGEYNKPTRSHVMRDPTFLMDSIFDRETRERKERQKFFDELIYRNGHVTFEDWMKWCTHNRRSVRPPVQIQYLMRKACLGSRFWKRQTRNRKRIFGKMPFHEIEKTINSQRRRMPKRAKRKPVVVPKSEPVLVWEEPAEVPVAWDDPGPKPRRKVKKKKYRTVMAHGYEQSVLCDDDGDAPSRPDPPSLDAPIVIKQKALITEKRTRQEAIAVLQSLRNKHHRLAEERKHKRRKARDDTKGMDAAWEQSHAGIPDLMAKQHGAQAFLAVSRATPRPHGDFDRTNDRRASQA